MVEERLEEACFVLKNVIAIRQFQHRRFARMIQKTLRKRVALVRRSAAIIVRAARGWLARGTVRRARIRRSILRHRGSLSRRARGLPEVDPFALTAVSERAGDAAREGCWWDVGVSVAPRPRWGTQRVEHEVERSRQRAASLGDLIRSGQELDGVRGGTGAEAAAASVEDRNERNTAQRRRSVPLAVSGNGRRAASTVVGFKKGASAKRAASMIDPREAEAAAWKHELARRQARKEALTMVVDFKKLSLREKHLLRQREFELEKQKRLLAAEKELQKNVRTTGYCYVSCTGSFGRPRIGLRPLHEGNFERGWRWLVVSRSTERSQGTGGICLTLLRISLGTTVCMVTGVHVTGRRWRDCRTRRQTAAPDRGVGSAPG